MDTKERTRHKKSLRRSQSQKPKPQQNRQRTQKPHPHARPKLPNTTQHKNKQNLLQKNENKVGEPQPQQQPNRQHPPKIPATRHNRIHHLPRNNPLHRKKTQPKLLEHHNQKIPRLPNQRRRPTNLLVYNTENCKEQTEAKRIAYVLLQPKREHLLRI